MNNGPGHPFKKLGPGVVGSWHEVHPIGNHRAGPIDGIDLPENRFSQGRADESRFVRCKQCGWINDTAYDTPGNPRGNWTFSDILEADGVTVAPSLKAGTVGAGCEFCGSSNFIEDDGPGKEDRWSEGRR